MSSFLNIDNSRPSTRYSKLGMLGSPHGKAPEVEANFEKWLKDTKIVLRRDDNLDYDIGTRHSALFEIPPQLVPAFDLSWTPSILLQEDWDEQRKAIEEQ